MAAMIIPTTTTQQSSARVRGSSSKAVNERLDKEEQARKEEIKEYIKEKWKRIAELEKLANSGVSSEEENCPTKSSLDRKIQKRASRASSVEYDPENPFDDDKSREQQKREERQIKTASRVSSSAALKRTTSVTTTTSETSAKSIESRRRQAVPPSSPNKAPSITKLSQESSPVKILSGLVRPRLADRPARPRTEGTKTVAPQARVSSNPVQVLANPVEIAKVQVRASSSKSRILIKSSSHESALENTASTVAAVESRRASKSDLGDRVTAEDEEKRSIVAKMDSPRRRKRRSEVPHHQPSFLRETSPLALSVETTNALAELEASLARLKAQSSSSSESASKSRRSSVPKDQAIRSRRSLSPAKEMRQLDLERSKEHHSSPSKLSFLQRVEMTRGEEEQASKSARDESRIREDISTEKKKEDQKEEKVEHIVEKRFKRHSYVPTRQQETNGASDESSCSIMIGEESIDDMVSQNMSLKFLRGIRVLVDVRDQDGEDASSGWVEKLRNVGAKVYTKVPSSTSSSSLSSSSPAKSDGAKLTHIVFKNGRPSTLHYLRSLNQSHGTNSIPIVVGVNWILQCLQQGTKIDERDFLVEVGKQAIFNKVRKAEKKKRLLY